VTPTATVTPTPTLTPTAIPTCTPIDTPTPQPTPTLPALDDLSDVDATDAAQGAHLVKGATNWEAQTPTITPTETYTPTPAPTHAWSWQETMDNGREYIYSGSNMPVISSEGPGGPSLEMYDLEYSHDASIEMHRRLDATGDNADLYINVDGGRIRSCNWWYYDEAGFIMTVASQTPIPTPGTIGVYSATINDKSEVIIMDGEGNRIQLTAQGQLNMPTPMPTPTVYIHTTDVVVEGDMQFDMAAHYDGEVLNTDDDGTVTIDWRLGNKQRLTVNSSPCVVTFTDPGGACSLSIVIVQGAGGGRTVAWPAIKWPAETPPTLSTAEGSEDYIALDYRGEENGYYGMAGLDYR
jgi:hypothetical protein